MTYNLVSLIKEVNDKRMKDINEIGGRLNIDIFVVLADYDEKILLAMVR